MKQPQKTKQPRGVFEKVPGSGVWWIRYFDQFGKKRREKAGTKSVAIKLYGKRKQQVLEGKKLPSSSGNRRSTSVSCSMTRSIIRRETNDPTRRIFHV